MGIVLFCVKFMPEKDFFLQVYQVVRLIPKGRVSSYGDIAAYLGAKGSARVVGYAMNAAHQVKPKVPAHRVVNRNGIMTRKIILGPVTVMDAPENHKQAREGFITAINSANAPN